MMNNPQTFRAQTTQAAFDQIQQELGPNALIVSVRQVPTGQAWETWKRPEVEVLALPGNDPAQAIHLPSAFPAGHATTWPAPQPARQNHPVGDGKNAAELAGFLLKMATKTTKAELPKSLASIGYLLIKQGVDAAVVKKVTTTCQEALSPAVLDDEERVRAFVRKNLEAYIHTARVDVISKDSLDHGKVICLIGPSGAGKTSTCAKLAALASRTLGKKVAWVSADTVRTGAIGLTKAFAEPLGIPLKFAYTPEELAQAVASFKDADLIVVDTPARNPRREADMVELGAFLTALPQRVTYLAAPATSKEGDLRPAIGAFGSFDLKGLVITKLDETTTFGSCLNLTWRTQIPIVYFTTGTRPLGDLQIASANILTGLILSNKGLMENR